MFFAHVSIAVVAVLGAVFTDVPAALWAEEVRRYSVSALGNFFRAASTRRVPSKAYCPVLLAHTVSAPVTLWIKRADLAAHARCSAAVADRSAVGC